MQGSKLFCTILQLLGLFYPGNRPLTGKNLNLKYIYITQFYATDTETIHVGTLSLNFK